ncbi:MAG: hypothetical protein QOJ26_1452 [Thermoplasmata archaeon]|nr:hypothetical protein [Thermoplasmata archaeon]
MNALAKALLSLAALGALLLAVPGSAVSESPPTTAPSSTSGSTGQASPIAFGMDAAAVSSLTSAGAKPDYGTFWIGPWTLSSGWGGPDGQLTAMKNAGVTPAIHFYYWGDDISPSCVEDGCYSNLHKAQKSRAGWETLGTQLTDHLTSKMQGKPAVIFLESEFNKGGIETYEPFDGYMAAMAAKIHAAYPNAIVVLGFGNWGSSAWGTFDRAAAEADMVGIQGMRGSTKQSKTDMMTLYDGILAGVKTLGTKFPSEPIMLTDIAVSSYPEPDYVTVQRDVVKEVFDNLPTLKGAGVEAIVYRSWKDSPSMDTANYYGMAERYWGLANSTGLKPSAQVWTDGVKAERAGSATSTATATASSTSSTSSSSSTSTSASATSTSASATSTSATKTSTSSSATSTSTAPVNRAPVAAFVAKASGLAVSLDAAASADADGDPLSYAWTFGDGSSASGKTASHAYAAAGTYTVKLTVSDGKASTSVSKAMAVSKPYSATFTQGSGASTFWVETKVAASPTPAQVEVKAGNGAWQSLRLRYTAATTTWGESISIAKGTMVAFRATSPDGQVATTAASPWLQTSSSTASATSASSTSATSTATASATSSPSSTATAFKATFTPKAVGNDWWVEAAVSGNQPVAKVEAKIGGGAWTVLAQQDWGNYAKSVNAPNGSSVQFRATTAGGATSTSATYAWT